VDFFEWAAPETRPAFQEALGVLKSMGMPMSETVLPDLPYGAMASTIISAEAASIFEDILRDGRVDQLADQRQIQALKASLETPAVEYLRAMRLRRLVQENFRKTFLDVDVLITPSRLTPATRVADPIDRRSGPDPAPSSRGLTGLSAAGNLAGLPALSLPCGFAGQLPVGLSLVAKPFAEHLLLAVGREFQKRTDWHRRRPPAA
jgi:aspartyl-tRNA(Asn)/glutamyl-tRNA(Gln) amidotransferase subunit A